MSTDYTKKRNAELEDLLKSRSLPHTGKKADLIARLQQHDTEQAQASKPTTTTITTSDSKPTTTTTKNPASTTTVPTTTTAADDEIDWEDDAATATAPSSSAAIAAGGLTQPPNPALVPNQAIDTDPASTSDLTVKKDPPTTKDPTTSTDNNTQPTPPKPDLSANLPTTTLDAELAKRQKRAARFGITESSDDALKALERAKKFGTGSEGDKGAVRGLDQALPERAGRGVKRGRGKGGDADVNANADGGDKRAGKRSRVRRERSGTPGKGGRGNKAGLSEKDREAAEKRKGRFTT